MNVSILSMQRIMNYGSFLQAYALKHILEQMGHKVDFIDILPGEYRESNSENGGRPIWKKMMNFLTSGHMIRLFRFRRSGKSLEALLKDEQYRILGLPDFPKFLDEKCDAVVIGSDEVFNCIPTCSWGVSTQLFGNINVGLVISYAASCGYMMYEDIPSQCRSEIDSALHHLAAVSVRDRNTSNFVQKISGIVPEIHLDPVLVYDYEDEMLKAEKELNISCQYMIVYSYCNRFSDEKEIRAITFYAKKNRLKMYCVGAQQLWCDEFPVWTPFQVLAAFKNAACIVTDTFHGTVLSAKYNKRFATFVRDSNANKLNDLIERLDLQDHRIVDINDLYKVLDSKTDYTGFAQIIKEQKMRTLNYLSTYLSDNR